MTRVSRRMQASALLALMMAIAGCPVPPAPLRGIYEESTVQQAQQQDLTGHRVRWGGSIVRVTPGEDDTCFEIVGRPLDAQARPRQTDDTAGRFLACAPGFYDPAVYGKEREVTVIGRLEQPVVRKIGEHNYRYPQVAAETIYLWPQRARTDLYYPHPDPFWYPWGVWPYGPWYWQPGPFGPWWRQPFWGVPLAVRSPIISRVSGATVFASVL